MKRLVLSILASAICLSMSSQNFEVIIFSEFGEKFTAYLNGTSQNEDPTNNVEIRNLNSQFFQLRIDFSDPALADFQMNNFVLHPGMVCTYMVKLNRKGRYVCRFQSESPISGNAFSTPSNSEIIISENEQMPLNDSNSGRVQQTKTTSQPESENISMDIKAPGLDISFNLTTSESETKEVVHVYESSSPVINGSQTIAKEEYIESGCNTPLGQLKMDQITQSIESKSFSDSKLIIAKQAIQNLCLKSSQVKTLVMLFDFEDDKLELAKYAYDFTFDKQNYYMVNDAFTFELSIEELNAYIQSK